MIAATEDANQAHLETLALLSQMLMDEPFRQQLMQAETKQQVVDIICRKKQTFTVKVKAFPTHNPAAE